MKMGYGGGGATYGKAHKLNRSVAHNRRTSFKNNYSSRMCQGRTIKGAAKHATTYNGMAPQKIC